jgi:hypothetical protein
MSPSDLSGKRLGDVQKPERLSLARITSALKSTALRDGVDALMYVACCVGIFLAFDSENYRAMSWASVSLLMCAFWRDTNRDVNDLMVVAERALNIAESGAKREAGLLATMRSWLDAAAAPDSAKPVGSTTETSTK